MEAIIITDEDMETAEHIAEILSDMIQNIKKAINAIAEALVQIIECSARLFREVTDIIRYLYCEVHKTAPNNWLKMHGLPMRRRGHTSRSA